MSKSGGIKIAKRDWGVAGNLRIARKTLPPNFDITWKTYPMFADTFAPGPKGTETVILQGVENTKHTLTIKPEAAGKLGIAKFKVYRPSPAPAGSSRRDVPQPAPTP